MINIKKEDLIRSIAYGLWEKAGCPSGRSDEFWYAAEKMTLVIPYSDPIPYIVPDLDLPPVMINPAPFILLTSTPLVIEPTLGQVL